MKLRASVAMFDHMPHGDHQGPLAGSLWLWPFADTIFRKLVLWPLSLLLSSVTRSPAMAALSLPIDWACRRLRQPASLSKPVQTYSSERGREGAGEEGETSRNSRTLRDRRRRRRRRRGPTLPRKRSAAARLPVPSGGGRATFFRSQ